MNDFYVIAGMIFAAGVVLKALGIKPKNRNRRKRGEYPRTRTATRGPLIFESLPTLEKRRDETPRETATRKEGSKIEKINFRPRALLSPNEYLFFRALREYCRIKYYIVPKVGLWAIVDSKDGWNKINQKHVDFIVCEPKTMKLLLAIELDDASHDAPEAKARDAEKDFILKKAGVKILRIRATATYSSEALGKIVEKCVATENCQ